MSRFDKNVPYYLCIRTDSYTGNFERELIAYAFGVLDEEQREIDYASEYIQAFWNCEANSCICNLEDYKNEKNKEERPDRVTELLKKAQMILDTSDMSDEETGEYMRKKEIEDTEKQKEKDEKDLCRISEEYLAETYREGSNTFYFIEGYLDKKDYDCVYVQLSKPLDGYMEDLIIRRIKGWFKNDVYNIFSRFSSIMMFGAAYNSTESPNLISIELMDNEGNVQKTYSME